MASSPKHGERVWAKRFEFVRQVLDKALTVATTVMLTILFFVLIYRAVVDSEMIPEDSPHHPDALLKHLTDIPHEMYKMIKPVPQPKPKPKKARPMPITYKDVAKSEPKQENTPRKLGLMGWPKAQATHPMEKERSSMKGWFAKSWGKSPIDRRDQAPPPEAEEDEGGEAEPSGFNAHAWAALSRAAGRGGGGGGGGKSKSKSSSKSHSHSKPKSSSSKSSSSSKPPVVMRHKEAKARMDRMRAAHNTKVASMRRMGGAQMRGRMGAINHVQASIIRARSSRGKGH